MSRSKLQKERNHVIERFIFAMESRHHLGIFTVEQSIVDRIMQALR